MIFFNSELLKKSDVEQLLKQGADPNYRRDIRRGHHYDPNKYDRSRHYTSAMPLLFFASGSTTNDLEIAQYLLEQGANVDKTASECIPPLGIAIRFGFINMVKLLLSYNPKFLDNLLSNSAYLTQAISEKNIFILFIIFLMFKIYLY